MPVAIEDCTLTSKVWFRDVKSLVSEPRLMKVFIGIKKYRNVTSSRVLTISVSRTHLCARGYRTIMFPFISTPML